MIRTIAFLFALVFLSTQLSNSASAQATPSFDCSKAGTTLEKLICSDPDIAAADASMAKLYANAQKSAFGLGNSNQLAAQRAWLPDRKVCISVRSRPSEEGKAYGPRACLISQYRQRNRELAVATLISHPDLALSVLRRDSPAIAPLYEALQLYLTKPVGAKWSDPAHTKTRVGIVALLNPYFADLKNDADKGYGHSVLSDIAASPEAAISGDANMASTIAIISAFIPNDDGVASFPFPCAALVKRPAMISVASPYFGSTLDNFLPAPDCTQSLPAQPRMEALSKALGGLWEGNDCGGGTIRFAVYRSYDKLDSSARIGLPVESGNKQPVKLARKSLPLPLVHAAIAELADQYQRYNGIAKADAEKRARYWLGRMIADAGECDG
jgi:uncharacterized protein